MKMTSFLLLLLLSMESCVPTYFSRIKVKTTSTEQKSSENIYIKNLLVLANGNISTRLVSDNFFVAFQKLVQKNGSKSDFEFRTTFRTGKNTEIIKTANNYEGYMLISPKDTASIDHLQKKFEFASPISSTRYAKGRSYGNAYEEIFSIKLFNSKNDLIYTGEVYFHFDPTRNEYYGIAAERLIKELNKSNIKLW